MEFFFKVGQTVYHPIYGEGKVISQNNCNDYPIFAEFKNGIYSFTLDGREFEIGRISLSQNPIPEIVNKPLTNEYIPFTFEDREFLRGKWIKPKKSIFLEKLIITFYPDGVGFYHNLHGITYKDLLDNYEFIDGSPCGKLTQ